MPQEQAAVIAPSAPSRITVVTGENFQEYVDDKLGVVAAPTPTPEEQAATELEAIEAKKAQAAEAKKAEEDPTHDLGDHVPEEKKGKLNKRFSELTQARKDAEARATKAADEAKAAREAADTAAREAAELRAKYEPPKPDVLGPEPQLSQFNDVDEYRKALTDWAGEKAIREREAKESEQRQAAEREVAVKEWNKRQEEVKATVEDYAEVIASSTAKVSDQIRDAILESEVGPQMLYHLAKHPEIADQLAAMPLGKALVKFGKIEASLSKATEEKPQEAATSVAEISKAPAPITPLKAANSPVGNKVNAAGEFIGTYEEYKALRQAGKIH